MKYQYLIQITLLALIGLVCQQSVALNKAAQGASQKASSSIPASDDLATFKAGVQYWANPVPLLCKEWYVVVGGTVLEKHKTPGYGAHPKPFTEGTLRVERVFISLPTKRQTAPQEMKYFKSDGFEDLKVGDKVIVFVNEYDGGYGIVEAMDSNCKLGIKVRDWNEPIVGAVEKIAADTEMAVHYDKRSEILKARQYANIWRPYSKRGIDYLLKGISWW